MAHLNLVLLGKTGAGKSSSGNTILGREAFESKKRSTPVTQDVVVEHGRICGIPVAVYDTPGFSGTESAEELRKYEEVLHKCESGPCVFLLVLHLGRFTQEEQETVEKIEEVLGENRVNNTWILFTGGDELEEENMTINQFINENEALKKHVQKYEGRCYVFNNKHTEERGDQIMPLIVKFMQRRKENLSKTPHQRISINIHDIPADHRSSRRIVLLGKSGVGKSAAGNTILGEEKFRSMRRMNSVTTECSDACSTVSGRSVSVVDTPGFFDTQMNHEELMMEIARSVYISSPGPHAFLIVFRVDDRFTDQEQQTPQIIEMMFGQEVLKYSIILFTHGDQLDEESVKELINENRKLSCLVDQCGGRFHVFDNRNQNNREQVNELLQKIDTMIEQNGGGHYSNQMFEDAHRFRQEEEEQRQREEEERKQQEEEQRLEEMERVQKETIEKIRQMKEALSSERERIKAETERYSKQEKQNQIESIRKETEEQIRAELKANQRSKQERFEAGGQREREQRKQQEERSQEKRQSERKRQEEMDKIRKETGNRLRADCEGKPKCKQRKNKFQEFFSKYRDYFYIAAVGAAVGAVCGVISNRAKGGTHSSAGHMNERAQNNKPW